MKTSLGSKIIALLLACGMIFTFSPAPVAHAEDSIPGKVLFTFDDGWLSQYQNAYDILNGAGFAGTIYVNSNRMDAVDAGEDTRGLFMSTENLQFLYDHFWDIANHTTNHHEEVLANNDEASLAEARKIFLDCQNWLIAKGMTRAAYHAAYPSGNTSQELINTLKDIGVLTARDTQDGIITPPVTAEDDYYKLPVFPFESDADLTQCKNHIADIAGTGKTVIIMIHKVEPVAGDLVATTANLQALVDYVQGFVTAGTIEVQTISQWYDEQSVNPVTGVTPPAPAVTNDDILNTVSGMTIIMEYSYDGAAYVPYTGAAFSALDLTGAHTLNVRYAASGENPAGPDTTLTFTINRKVSFDSNGGSEVADMPANDGGKISPPAAPTLTGYTFDGWYKDDDPLTDDWDFATDTVTADITLHAKWTINNYTVTFDKNGGNVDANPVTINADYNTTVTLPAQPGRTGHTFDSWNTKADGTGTAFTASTPVTGNITVFAKWTINSYTVTFDKNGGEADASPTTRTVNYNTPAVLPAAPKWTGHEFAGWNTLADGNGTAFTASTPVTGNITVFAQWTIGHYTVTFNKNGGDSDAEPTTAGADYNTTVTLPTPPTRTGYTFDSWNTKADGTGTAFTASTPVTGHITVYAKWSINTYTVTFDKNGGATEANPKTKIVNYNFTVVTLPTPPTKAGATFTGWNTTADGTGTAFTASTRVTDNVTVYAQWLATPVINTPTPAYSSLKLTWAAVSGASGYEVWYSTTLTGTYTKKATVTTTYYTHTGLTTNKTYYYKIRAYRTGSPTVYSAYSAVRYGKPMPAAPTSPKATPSAYNSIRVSWGAVSGATKYEVHRATSLGGTYSLVATTGSLYCANTVDTGRTYYYKVRAYRLIGTTKAYGAFSNPVVSAKTSMAVPTSVRAVRASSSSIKITWGASAGTTRYEVWRSTSSAGTYTLAATTASLYFTNTGLTTGRTYYYKVRAYRLVGSTKVYSAYSTAVYARTTMAAPTSVKAVRASSSSIKISWGASDGATRYEVWRCTTGPTGTYSLIATTASLSSTNTGLTAGRTYWYKVCCYRLVGTTKVYSAYSAAVYARP